MPTLDRGPAIAVGVALVALVTAADLATGFEVRLAMLYLAPVTLVTWNAGPRWGVGIALLSALAWAASFGSLHVYSRDVYFYWDGIVLGATLAAFCLLLARLRDALEHSDERFLRVLDGIDAAVFVTDEAGKVPYANRRLAALVGGDAVPLDVPAIAGRFVPHGERETSMTQPSSWGDGTEVVDVRDGRRYLVQARDITWVDRARAHLVVMNDVTAQRTAEDLQRQHVEAMHRTGRIVALTEATTTVAHELNQPLAAIVGYNAACLRLLEGAPGELGEIREAMEKCRAQAVRAGEILKRLRELTQRRAPAFEPCDVNDVVRKSLAWLERDLERAGVSVGLELDRRIPTVEADRVLIEQVLLNLVQNAVDAMRDCPSSRRHLTVSSSPAADGTVCVTVADRGHGIPPDVSERLYSPFFTTKRAGLGLGLSICRSIVEMHRGRLTHRNREGGGAEFEILLPPFAR
ncbi:MAG: ATP-binding protein [Burkholderiales bacterium]